MYPLVLLKEEELGECFGDASCLLPPRYPHDERFRSANNRLGALVDQPPLELDSRWQGRRGRGEGSPAALVRLAGDHPAMRCFLLVDRPGGATPAGRPP